MHTKIAILAASMLLCSSAIAGDGMSDDAKFKKMDTNKDGMVSADEHAAGASAMFKAMDANGDGSVTAAEMTASMKAMGGKPMKGEMSVAETIRMIDTDKNGAVSMAEHDAASASMFQQADADGNGSLSMAEMKAAHKAMAKHGDGMRHDAMAKPSTSM